jgi:hypothetical protein
MTVLLLGQADASFVVYDVKARMVYRLPTKSVVLQHNADGTC